MNECELGIDNCKGNNECINALRIPDNMYIVDYKCKNYTCFVSGKGWIGEEERGVAF